MPPTSTRPSRLPRGFWPGRATETAAITLALLLGIAGVVWSTTAASGPDAHGYVSQADRWLAGTPTVDQSWASDASWPLARWTLAPLGYRPSQIEGREWNLAPAYSPGFPWLMAAAKLLGGQEAMFWVVPACGVVLVLATFGIGRRLLDPGSGLIAAWLVATSPAVLFMLMLPMSDVPAAAAWAVSFYLFLDRRGGRMVLAGAAAGLAITIRPNLAPGAAILAAASLGPLLSRDPAVRRQSLWPIIAFIPGVAAGAGAVAAVNWLLNGSPFRSGYGDLSDAFSSAFLLPNLVRYGGWLVETQSPLAVVGLAALAIPSRTLWLRAARPAIVAMATFVAGVWGFYGFYREFDAWWFLRFLLPTWPFIMVGSASVLGLLKRRGGRVAGWIIGGVVVILGVWQVTFATNHGAFRLWKEERRAVTVARQVRQLTSPESIIFSLQHSGSVRYYGGRLTGRFEEFEPGDFDRAVAWFAERGVRSYLLLDDNEVPLARRRLEGQAAAAVLDARPILHYSGALQVYLYDLDRRNRDLPTASVIETWEDTRSVQPAPWEPPALAR